MKVKELIAALQKFDQEMICAYHCLANNDFRNIKILWTEPVKPKSDSFGGDYKWTQNKSSTTTILIIR